MPLTNAEKTKRYRERHPERFRASLLKYWKTKYVCECGKTLTKKNKAVHNRSADHLKYIDYMETKRKLYYLENKDELMEKAKKIVVCECGEHVTNAHLSRHRQTEKHLSIMGQNDKLTKNTKAKEKVVCECGEEITYAHIARHRKTQNHISRMEKTEVKEDSETSSEEEEYINNYISIG